MRALAWVLVSAISLSAWADKKTFVYCSEGSPKTFNPQLAGDGPTFNASGRTVYNRLVDFAKGSTKIVPSLAEKWAISKDGTIYTFNLRKNVAFQTTEYFKPTRTFNADDVIFSFERQRNPQNPYYKVGGGTYEYFKSMEMDTAIKEIVKVDDYTVKFVLSKPQAPFLANMAMDFASILSKEYADELLKKGTPDRIDNYPVGTGPFVFKSYQKDTLIRFEAHPQYFEGKPAIDKLVFSITTDPTVRTQKLKRGECDLIAEPAPNDLPALKQDGKVVVKERAGLNVGYIAFNEDKKPFDNVKVRQAIDYALNRANYIKAIYLGNAELAKNPIPPTMWSYNQQVKNTEYNPEKAKALLKEAGLANGFEMELWTLPVSRPYNPDGKKMGEMVQADLAKVGIKVKLVTYDWPTYLEKARLGEHQALEMGWQGDNGDPDNFLGMLLSCAGVKAGSNFAHWCHAPFNELIEKAKTTPDLKKRTDYYSQAQAIFKTQVPWVTVAHAKLYRAMSSRVSGFELSPFGYDSFYGVDLK